MSTSSKSRPARGTCATIPARSPRTMLSALRRALDSSEFAELRLDFLRPADVPEALELATPYLHRCVCTLRPVSEGGSFEGRESERISVLKLAAEYSPMLLDVEMGTMRSSAPLRSYLRRTGTRILVSWHDFEKTPPAGSLRRRLAAMSRYSDIVKIVTMARGVHDSSRVLALYASAGRTELVAFCMGDHGQASRVLCMCLGSPFTYVSTGRPAAPGQLSLERMRRLMPPGGIGRS